MYLLVFLISYLIGTIPVAYWLVRVRTGRDLRQEGSTNIGAMNAGEVTGSKALGVQVAVLDVLKGAVAVLLGWGLVRVWGGESFPFGPLTAFAPAFWVKSVALIGCVAGHNYNIFLSMAGKKLSGGKGFASAAGGFLLTLPALLPLWLILCYLGIANFARWRGVKDTTPGGLLASGLLPVVAWLVYGWPAAIVTLAFAVLTIPKHLAQWRALLAETE